MHICTAAAKQHVAYNHGTSRTQHRHTGQSQSHRQTPTIAGRQKIASVIVRVTIQTKTSWGG